LLRGGLFLSRDKNIVIIGCGAGGGTAAQFSRKTDRSADITIFEKGLYPQYSKCGLPYAISKEIPKIKDLIEFSEDWFKKAKINLHLNTYVEKIDVTKKIVIAKKENETIEKKFNSIIICTGAKPVYPPIKNLDVKGVFTLRTIDDAKKIQAHAKEDMKVAIVGAGLIGLEMADNFYKMGLKVTIIEALPSILANNIDLDMAKLVSDKIPEEIRVFTNHLATKIDDEAGVIKKTIIKNRETGEEKTIDTDLLLITAGTKPDISLAESIGCKIGNTGGIVVNSKSETTVADVYAVGDCTEYRGFLNDKPTLIGLGSIVVRQAISAGINAAGGRYNLPKGVLNTFTSEFFDLEIAGVGLCVRATDTDSAISGKYNGISLPHYFPGGKPVTIKVYADESGKILGAQCVGDKAAQRINTFACAILAGFDIETFRKLETAYAPPIAPTLDAETLVCDIVSMKLKRLK
jgi:NADH oxidase (H2O2-forming)